jgi:hypothetical protein
MCVVDVKAGLFDAVLAGPVCAQRAPLGDASDGDDGLWPGIVLLPDLVTDGEEPGNKWW